MTTAHHVTKLSEFVEYLERGVGEIPFTIYRGQSEDWPLLPRVARCDLLGGTFDEVERKMFADFMRAAPTLVTRPPDNDWDWLAIAQHHGLSTRLLDWTKNPLCALWFAVRTAASDATKYGVVWALTPADPDIVRDVKGSPSRFDKSVAAGSPLSIGKTMVFEPRYVTARVRTQEGLFTVHHSHSNERDQHFIPLEENEAYRDQLEKVLVPASSFATLRHQLLSCGVHSGSLFPDLDGLASRLEMEYVRSANLPFV